MELEIGEAEDKHNPGFQFDLDNMSDEENNEDRPLQIDPEEE